MAEYIGNKKSTTTSSSIVQPTEDKLSDMRIEEIYAEFNANGSGLAAIAPDLATTVNKKLTQSNRNEFIAQDQTIKTPIVEKAKTNHDDIWQEDDDEDDDFPQQQIVKPVKNIPIPSTDQEKTQQVREKIPLVQIVDASNILGEKNNKETRGYLISNGDCLFVRTSSTSISFFSTTAHCTSEKIR